MKNKSINILLCIWAISFSSSTKLFAQIPFEVFYGDKRATLDLMFFKYLENESRINKRFLFFNRNRTNFNSYFNDIKSNPQFGFTEAFSYNHEKLNGLAPVLVFQILNTGIYSKSGIQYAYIKPNLLLFTWLVIDHSNVKNLDYFVLLRHLNKFSETTYLFKQIESINTFSTNNLFTQRLRLGIGRNKLQFGIGVDLSQSNNINSSNTGIFIRKEF